MSAPNTVRAGFLLLFIYAMINMNIVSWGTREVANVDDVEIDIANRVKQPNIWTSFIHEVHAVLCTPSSETPTHLFFSAGWAKKRANRLMAVILSNLNQFRKKITGRFPGKFAVKCKLKIPPHLACVARLPCETLLSSDQLRAASLIGRNAVT